VDPFATLTQVEEVKTPVEPAATKAPTDELPVYKYITPITSPDPLDKKAFSSNAIVFLSATIDSERSQHGVIRWKAGITEDEYDKNPAFQRVTGKSYRDFMSEFRILLTHSVRKLDMSDPLDYLTYQVLRTNKMVADGEQDRSNKPGAKFVILDPQETAKNQVKKYTAMQEAAILLSSMSVYDKRELLYLYGIVPINMNDTEVVAMLSEEVFSGPGNTQRFINYMQDPNRAQRILVFKAYSRGLIKKGSDGYYHERTNLGRTLEEAMNTLDQPGFVNVKAAILKEVG
jgi:hypothetical protein